MEATMNLEMMIGDIELRDRSDKGWISVATQRDFFPGEVIEACPIAVLNLEDSKLVEQTLLKNLCCWYKRRLVVPGGYGSVYIPSEELNADYEIYEKERMMVVRANKWIEAGSHVHIDRGTISVSLSESRIEYDRMTEYVHSDGLIVKPSPGRGLGTFTTREFKKGEYVEIVPLVRLTRKQSRILKETEVNGFMYAIGKRDQLSGWALGYPCFYNHSDYTDDTPDEPNIDPWNEIDSIEYDHLAVKVLKDLKADTELVFDYTDGEKKKDINKELGFRVR